MKHKMLCLPIFFHLAQKIVQKHEFDRLQSGLIYDDHGVRINLEKFEDDQSWEVSLDFGRGEYVMESEPPSRIIGEENIFGFLEDFDKLMRAWQADDLATIAKVVRNDLTDPSWFWCELNPTLGSEIAQLFLPKG